MAKNIIKIYGHYISDVQNRKKTPASTSIEDGKLYLMNSSNEKIDNGTVLPTGTSSGGTTTSTNNAVSTTIESGKLYLKNSAGTKIDSGTLLPKSPAATSVESNKLYLLDDSGLKIDNGTPLPISSVDTTKIPVSTSVESNKLYLKNSAGTKIDAGTELPIPSVDTTNIPVSTSVESNKLYLKNSAGTKIDSGTSIELETLSEAQKNIIINEILDGVVPKYKTKAQYDTLPDDEKNDPSIEYHITDVDGVILTSPDGSQFKLKVANDGTLSTEKL